MSLVSKPSPRSNISTRVCRPYPIVYHLLHEPPEHRWFRNQCCPTRVRFVFQTKYINTPAIIKTIVMQARQPSLSAASHTGYNTHTCRWFQNQPGHSGRCTAPFSMIPRSVPALFLHACVSLVPKPSLPDPCKICLPKKYINTSTIIRTIVM